MYAEHSRNQRAYRQDQANRERVERLERERAMKDAVEEEAAFGAEQEQAERIAASRHVDDGRDTYDPADAPCLRIVSSTPRTWEEHANPMYESEVA